MVTRKDVLNIKTKIFKTAGLKSKDVDLTHSYVQSLQAEDYDPVVFYKGNLIG